MNFQSAGPKRPKLSLAYGRTATAPSPVEQDAASLSPRELRRIVSEMLG